MTDNKLCFTFATSDNYLTQNATDIFDLLTQLSPVSVSAEVHELYEGYTGVDIWDLLRDIAIGLDDRGVILNA